MHRSTHHAKDISNSEYKGPELPNNFTSEYRRQLSGTMADINIGNSEISEWYRNKTIFVTGGTGFMGKVLVEKLLRACNIRRIYLLMRPKKGVEVRQRLDDMINIQMFDNVRTEQPEMLQKIVPVKGDITMEGLGLSDEDEARLAEEVEVIFHCAATINFQEPLRVAVNMNMLGTKRVVALAHKMVNIKALVHVSTAYGNCHLSEIYEELYPPPIDPARLIQLTEWFDDEMLEAIAPKLVDPRPNTYTYTKALAEHLLVNDSGSIPYSIVRPSIVCGAWREPMPGWVDNMFAFNGFLVGMGKGVLRSLYIKPGLKPDFIPVDICINLMITSAWNTDVQKLRTNGSQVFCCSTSSQNPLSSDVVVDYLKDAVRKYPLNSALWYPGGSAKSSRFTHQIHMFFVNVLPAYITDIVLRVLGKKPTAVKLCNRMLKAIDALEYFCINEWKFHNTNTRSLYELLGPSDKETFNFDIAKMDWEEYIETYQLGVKQYIVKEPISTLPESKTSMNRLYWLNCILQLILLYGAWCIVSSDNACVLYSAFFHGASYLLSCAPFFVAAEESGLLEETPVESLIS